MAFAQKEIKTTKGNTFVLQQVSAKTVSQINDRIMNKHGVPSNDKLADEMLEHIVVNPRKKQNDFTGNYKELKEIVSAAYKFINGEDEDEEDETSAEDEE